MFLCIGLHVARRVEQYEAAHEADEAHHEEAELVGDKEVAHLGAAGPFLPEYGEARLDEGQDQGQELFPPHRDHDDVRRYRELETEHHEVEHLGRGS